ncbi:hypothetical protein O0I10_006679 [Lichtheimia ornata]|uniref:Uncharacterized protein n=1 Tax=Lichtheimia ornata TaxID=688661 RepID=A0AAD7V3P1_9FUNG|nr:uncharacterized protein O0I10_006679 [Lichtheimia ornata]KAJ8657615.1 hypothetical protein O0I10_006679 [Lichtheimia ornata]
MKHGLFLEPTCSAQLKQPCVPVSGSNSSISNLAMSPPAKMKTGRPPETFWLASTNAKIAIDEFDPETFAQGSFDHAEHAGIKKSPCFIERF